MVWAPASRPWSMSSLRRATISSSPASGVRPGLARPGPWLQPGLALGVEAPAKFVDPPPRHPTVPGHVGLRPSLDPERGDHQLPKRHRPPLSSEVGTMSRDRVELCCETRHCRGHSDLLLLRPVSAR